MGNQCSLARFSRNVFFYLARRFGLTICPMHHQPCQDRDAWALSIRHSAGHAATRRQRLKRGCDVRTGARRFSIKTSVQTSGQRLLPALEDARRSARRSSRGRRCPDVFTPYPVIPGLGSAMPRRSADRRPDWHECSIGLSVLVGTSRSSLERVFAGPDMSIQGRCERYGRGTVKAQLLEQ